MARIWTDIQTYESQIMTMRSEGKSRREIANILGLNLKQIENYITRYNKRQTVGISLKQLWRPRKTPQTPEGRIAELEREIALLRSFLHAAGRM